MNREQRNILRVFEAATGAEKDAGLRWYLDAHLEAVAISAETGLSVAQSAAIISALSPRCEWSENLRKAWMLARTGDTYGLSLHVRKAAAIRSGALDPVDAFRPSTGPKTLYFFRLILDPTDPHAVVLDGHALAVREGILRPSTAPRIQPLKYLDAADDYIQVARHLKVRPSQVQAVTWTAWRNLLRDPARAVNL